MKCRNVGQIVGSGIWVDMKGDVQARFAGVLISRRKEYGVALRDTLPRLLELQERGDYEATHVSQTQAGRALSRAQEFVSAVVAGGERQ